MVVSSIQPTKSTIKANSEKNFQDAYYFIKNHRTSALATTDERNVPHVAYIYSLVKPNLSIYFSTRVESRKYRNLKNNKTVSMTFGDEEIMSSVQLTGVAERVNNLALEQDIYYKLFAMRLGRDNWQIPPARLFARGATNEIAIIKVSPIEMTYANFASDTPGHYKPFFTKII